MAGHHWMHRQLSLSEIGNRDVDRAGSHQGELVVPGFPLGSTVTQDAAGASPNYGAATFKVVGYHRGNVVLEGEKGTTHQAAPGHLQVVSG